MAGDLVTRGMVFTLDVSPAEERLLRSYWGAARKAHNWVIAEAMANLEVRKAERAAGVPEANMTPALSWSPHNLSKRWNEAKHVEAPWWREVSMHAFRSGIMSAAVALENWHGSKAGKRRGGRMGFPGFKSKRRSTPSISFVEINHQLSWFHPSRHHIRLMLPKSSPDPDFARRRRHIGWLHTIKSTSALYHLVESGAATIQKVTISYRGGRWRAAFQVRYRRMPGVQTARRLRPLVGVDVGIRHLATLSQPVKGITDGEGHVPNPAVLDQQLGRLRKLDRQIARSQKDSRSHRRLLHRRARFHGRVASTRALHLHRLSTALVDAFDVVGVEDLNLKGMSDRRHHLGRRLADAGLGELRRQLAYKAADRGNRLIAVGRFYPSSKICSRCGAVKAKLPLWERNFTCDGCGMTLDRDVNAASNIAQEAKRLVAAVSDNSYKDQQDGAGLRPDSENAHPRPHKTPEAAADGAKSPEGGTKQPPPKRSAT